MDKKIIERLQTHTADALVLWVKFHNLHWHVHGAQFKPVHEATEAYYNALADDYDAFAERLVQLKAQPPVTLKQSLARSAYRELEKTSFTTGEVMSAVKEDFATLLIEYKTTRALCAEAGDTTTEAMFVDAVAKLEKQLWMLEASLTD